MEHLFLFNWAGILVLLGIWSIAMGTLITFVNYLNDQMHPENPYAWLDKHIDSKIWFEHPSAKIKLEGRFGGVELATGQAPKGRKRNYDIIIRSGKKEKYYIPLYQQGKLWDFK